MGDLSPVLAAFLQGQHGQTSLLQQAHQVINEQEHRKLQREQLEAATRQHAIENAREQSKLELELKQFGLQHQIQMLNHENTIREQFRSGARQTEGTSFQIPGMQTVQPSAPGTPLDITQGIPSMVNTPYQDQYVDTPMGPLKISNIDTPAMRQQQHIKDLMATLPFERLKAEATQAPRTAQLESRLEQQQKQFESTLASHEAEHTRTLEMQKYLGDLRSSTQQQLSELRANQAAQDALRKIGYNDPEEARKGIVMQAYDRSTGRQDRSATVGQEINNRIEATMKDLGIQDLPGGTKTRQGLFTIFDNTEDLLNKADYLVKNFPPPTSLGSQAGQAIAGLNPWSTISKAYGDYKSDLTKFAQSKGITSSKLYDSNKEQSLIANGMISPTDDPAVVELKKLHLISGAFTGFQGQISGLPAGTRKDMWKDVMNAHPQLKKDPRLEKVWESVLSTGTFNPSVFNKLLPKLR